MLTLPICSWIKNKFKDSYIIFIGKEYTLPVLESYKAIDEICNWSEFETLNFEEQQLKFKNFNADTIIHVFPNKNIARLAKIINIPNRIGTSHRFFHYFTCNYKVNFTRKRSELHEAQLNYNLLKPLGLKKIPSLEEIEKTIFLFQPIKKTLPENIENFIKKHKNYVIIHPKSRGSAVEWNIDNYIKLAELFNKNGIAVAFTGTENEGLKFRNKLELNDFQIDTSGSLSLSQLITFIGSSNGIVACSTGPLHIGGFLNVKTIGLFSNKRPIHSGRWKPLGNNVYCIVSNKLEDLNLDDILPEKVIDVYLNL
jgi:ADP-heptose:LPS heptosyltransferase